MSVIYWKKYKKKIILFLILLILVLLEVFLRIFYSEKFPLPSRPLVYEYDSITNYKYIPDTTFNILKNSYRINKDGFIGEDFSENDKLFKIAIVGSSTVAGSINKSELHTFCSHLQNRFNNELQQVEILNCGIDGAGRSLDIFKSIRYKVLDLNPDLILLEYNLPFETINYTREIYNGYIITYPSTDIGREYCIQYVDNLKKFEKIIDFLYHSYIMRATISASFKLGGEWASYVYLYQGRIVIYGRWTKVEYTLSESIEMIKILQEDLKQRNIGFFLFQIDNNRDIKNIANKNKLPLLSLHPPFDKDDFWYNDEHLNENGCKKTADSFWKILTKYNLYNSKH